MADTGKAWLEHFSTDEIRELRQVSNVRACLTLLTNFGLIAAAMALVAAWPNVFTVLLALLIIGTRQLGFAVVMHEAAHKILFTNRTVNDWAGNWLGGYPIYLSASMYRPHHLEHHAKNWAPEDPDLPLVENFPVSKASMARKVARDLLGITGLKRLLGTSYLVGKAIAGHEPVRGGTLPMRLNRPQAIQMVLGTVITNGMLFALLWALGQPLLYLLWVGAWFTTNNLVARIRLIAEHAVIADPSDPLQNARTVHTSWWERLFIAPNLVQYHLEHHLLMTVPHYHLPRFHALLRERGLLDGACVADGYPAVLRSAVL